ncbi:MAG TPA: hypothetical protein VE570_12330 [Thermoleophilaceae bacterium]|jgi:hypothetical protein|nr:hypothetical protein [Thermoleophilaceae bacterium]
MDPFVRNTSVRERIIWFEVQKLERRQMHEAARAEHRDDSVKSLGTRRPPA